MNLIEQIQAKRDQERFNACVWLVVLIVFIAAVACSEICP